MLAPAGPHRVGHGHLRQQQGRVHRLGALLAQHGRHHRPCCHVQGDRELRPHRLSVLAGGHDVQPGGVDLHQLARPQRHHRREGPHRHGGGGAGGTPRVFQRVGQDPHQPVERRRRRQRHRARPVGLGQDLPSHLPQPLQRARGAAALAAQRLQHRGHHPLIRPPGRARRPALADQAHDAARVVAGAHAAHGGPADPRPAQGREFVGLGLLPLGHRGALRVVGGPGGRRCCRTRRAARSRSRGCAAARRVPAPAPVRAPPPKGPTAPRR
ncbi:hypothetical protein RKD31_000548 [Streptomyces sp. SAI-163]